MVIDEDDGEQRTGIEQQPQRGGVAGGRAGDLSPSRTGYCRFATIERSEESGSRTSRPCRPKGKAWTAPRGGSGSQGIISCSGRRRMRVTHTNMLLPRSWTTTHGTQQPNELDPMDHRSYERCRACRCCAACASSEETRASKGSEETHANSKCTRAHSTHKAERAFRAKLPVLHVVTVRSNNNHDDPGNRW